MLFDLEEHPNQFRSAASLSRARPLLDAMRLRLLRHNMEMVDPLPERVAAY